MKKYILCLLGFITAMFIGVSTAYGTTNLSEMSYEKNLPHSPPDPGVYFQPEIYGKQNFRLPLYNHCDFRRDDAVDIVFTYNMSHPKLKELRKKYDLDTITGNGNTFEKTLRLMNWVNKNVAHSSNKPPDFEKENSLVLLDYAYQKRGVNCLLQSIIFSESCLAMGIKAKPFWLMPQSPQDQEGHTVVIAYIPELKNWIMLDATANTYFTDKKNNALAPWEIRKKLLRNEPLEIIINNKEKIDSMTKEELEKKKALRKEYIAKNCFYFYTLEKSTFGRENCGKQIYSCPKGFDMTEHNLKALYSQNETMMKYYELPDTTNEMRSMIKKALLTDKDIKKREKKIRNNKYIYATFESFWRE